MCFLLERKYLHENQIYLQALYIILRVIFLIKKWIHIKKTGHQIHKNWFGELLLHHCSIYISVPSPNESFYKYDFLKKLMTTWLRHSVTKPKNVHVALCICFFGNILNVIYESLGHYVSQQKQCL